MKQKNMHDNDRNNGHRKGKINVYLSPPPAGLEQECRALLTPEAVDFLVDLSLHFQHQVDQLYAARLERKCTNSRKIPSFARGKFHEDNWRVAPVGERLQNRRLDLGDVSPSDYMHFTRALKARVQGIQVDFDDGHCPSWKNQIIGLHNVYRAVRNDIPNVPPVSQAPVLMFRPRAWNMLEHNASVAGRVVPGPLFDFALVMFHNAEVLANCGSGPFFYLSKLESAAEARLWNEIFVWSQLKLRLPYGTIKACVLIENILAAFEMEQILYELRDHSLGLNCGIWDYAASIIAKFGADASFLLPDRNKYVSMDRPFLKKYMDLVVRTCHRRGAHATGGMSAKLLPARRSGDFDKVLNGVLQSKLAEIQAGVDGFMVYDLQLVDYINDLWHEYGGPRPNQIGYLGTSEDIKEAELLALPSGGVTEVGLRHNITVGILFIFHWLCGKGVFALKGSVEDSATAEISRAQIWQWIRHSAPIEDQDDKTVTRSLVFDEASGVFEGLVKNYGLENSARVKLGIAFNVFLQIVNQRDFPDFITTYLNDAYIFRKVQANL